MSLNGKKAPPRPAFPAPNMAMAPGMPMAQPGPAVPTKPRPASKAAKKKNPFLLKKAKSKGKPSKKKQKY